MGIARGPNIVTDNLVFGYDTGYGIADNTTATRFYPGEPSDNLLYKTGAANLATGGDIYVNSTKTSLGNGKYKWVNDGTGGTTIRIYCNLSDLTDGESYAISLFYEGLIGSVSLDWCDTSITGYSNTNGKITGIGTRATYTSTFRFLDINLSTGGSVVLYNPQIERKSHTTPFVDGIRSDTASLIDLKRTTSIDVSNVSFDSTGQPTFDGTDDRLDNITAIGISNYSAPFSMECVFKVPTSGTWANNRQSNVFSIAGSYAGQYGIYKKSTDTIGFQIRDASTSGYCESTGHSKNVYHHVIVTFGGGSGMKLYINSELKSSNTTSFTGTPDTTNLYIGGTRSFGGSSGSWYEGEIPIAKYYNKELTAEEIKQNYKAYKNRFNI